MNSDPGKDIPKVKFTEGTPKLSKVQLEFMKLIEEQNLQRVNKLKRVRRNNLLTGGALMTSVIGIYIYSMVSIKQERFLEDFDEPKKVGN